MSGGHMQLKGAKVLLTGNFKGQQLEALEEQLAAQGAKVVKKVSMEVEAVFAGDEPGREYDQARELGIRVYSSKDLSLLLSGKTPTAEKETVDDSMYDGYMMDAAMDAGPADYVVYEEAYAMSPEAGGKPAKSPGAPVASSDSRGKSSRQQSSTPKPTKAARNDGDGQAKNFDKGDRVKIVSGLEGVGVVGEIFWWNKSKFGEGMRAGISGPGDTTYWVDEEHLGWPDEEIDDEVIEAAKVAAQFKRGDNVRVVSGKDAGAEGTIFWWGESKFGDGMRAGIEVSGGDKVWAAANELEHADGGGSDDDLDPISDDDIPF